MWALQITHGVRVTARPLFVPEHSRRGTALAPALQRYFFAYSIRFSLLSVADQKAAGIRKPIKFVQVGAVVRSVLTSVDTRWALHHTTKNRKGVQWAQASTTSI